jgi:phosphate starvation-inducible PhoH-like protein
MQDFSIRLGNWEKSVNLFPEKLQVPCTFLNLNPGNPVNFLLGKTLDDSIILVNEAEQYTKSNMRLILTRLGENSKIIITGDSKQVNRRSIKNNTEECGLTYACDCLSSLDEVSITEFNEEDIVRNGLITKILQKFDS